MTTTILDMDHLALYVGEDQQLRNEVLVIYREQLGKWLEEMHVDMEDEPWRHASHSLKGASRGVGAWSIGDVCYKAESAVGDSANTKTLRADLLNTLKGLASHVFEEIDALTKEIAA